MKELKKYNSVIRYGNSSTKNFLNKGDLITITEKVDGANTSFIQDNDNELGVSCFSRRQIVTKDLRLNGYYGWIETTISPIKDKLNPNYRYIGEWTLKHKVNYKKEHRHKFLLISIWDEINNLYLDDEIVISEAKRLGLETVEFFYIGPYISYEHMASFIGKSNITEIPDTGEGIVVKNSKYRNSNKQQIMVKLVTEKFAELVKQRLPKEHKTTVEYEIVKSILTPARVDKMLNILIEDGLLDRYELKLEFMSKLIKLTFPLILEDMLKEEADILSGIPDNNLIKQNTGKILPISIKEVLKDYIKICEYCRIEVCEVFPIGVAGSDDFYQLEVCDKCVELLCEDYHSPEVITEMMSIK